VDGEWGECTRPCHSVPTVVWVTENWFKDKKHTHVQGSYTIFNINFRLLSGLEFSEWPTQVKYRRCNI